MRRSTMAGAVLLAASMVGCNSGSALIDVDGTVTVNGKEVKEGDIFFTPADRKFGGEGGKIKEGRFAMKARPGKNTVTFLATEVVPGKTMPSAAGPGAPPDPVRESIIPPKYEKGVEEEVGPGKKTFTFALTK